MEKERPRKEGKERREKGKNREKVTRSFLVPKMEK